MKAEWAVCAVTVSGKPGPEVRSRPAPDAIACANGCTRLPGTEFDAARYVAIPICLNVLLVPEAIPAWRGSTTLTAVDASGALTKPMPTPATTKPGRSVVHAESTEIPDMSSSATPQSASPPDRRNRTGTL